MALPPFITLQNERSFSSLIDRVVTETGKTSSLLSIVAAANMTIRECQTFGLFAQDLLEEDFVADVKPYIWYRPLNFKSIQSVRYAQSLEYPKLRRPGVGKNSTELYYFYAADNYYVFNGTLSNETVHFANYYWRKPLFYNARIDAVTTGFQGGPYPKRPAYYDIAADIWMYLNLAGDAYIADTPPTVYTADQQETKQKNAMNWLLMDWFDLIAEGTKAKILKNFGDERAAASYGLYKSFQKVFLMSNGFEAEAAAIDT